MGRPRIDINEVIDQVEQLAGRGLSIEQIAASVDVSPRWLYTKQKSNKKMREAIIRGRGRANALVVNALFRNATENNNLGAQIFWLANKDPDNWKNPQHLKQIEPPPTDKPAAERYTAEDYEAANQFIHDHFSN